MKGCLAVLEVLSAEAVNADFKTCQGKHVTLYLLDLNFG